jgi:NodT family efflux transporter outer membrane factor (OMF) lipoprotein
MGDPIAAPTRRTLVASVRLAACAWLLVGATGCPITPKFVRPETHLPPGWSGANDPRIAARNTDAAWWHAFKDPALDRLIELAYQQNLPLQVAGLRILEARAQLGIAKALQYPTNPGPIGTGGLTGFNDHNVKTGDVDFMAGRYQVGFDASWEIDFWGKYRRGVKAARAAYYATVADYDDALVALAAEVARTYALVRTYQVFIDLAQKNVAVQEEGLHLAESRFRNGATSELDPAQAATILANTRASIPELQSSLQQAENALCTLLGRAPGCAAPLITGPSAIPSPPPQVAAGVPAELLRRRPDIRAVELRAYAQCDRIGVARADFYPRLVLGGSVGTIGVNSTGAPANLGALVGLFNPGTLIYSIGASLFFPILSYPQILSNVRVQDARLQQLYVDYQNTVLRAAQEVEDGMTGFLREQEAAMLAAAGVTSAETAVRISVTQYKEGAADFQRVLDAERELLSTENNQARMRSAATTNLIALYKALGGGWELRQGQPVVSDGNRVEMQKRTNWNGYFDKAASAPHETTQR